MDKKTNVCNDRFVFFLYSKTKKRKDQHIYIPDCLNLDDDDDDDDRCHIGLVLVILS